MTAGAGGRRNVSMQRFSGCFAGRPGNSFARNGRDGRYAFRLAGSVPVWWRRELKAREADIDNEETRRLKSLVADLSMSNEVLRKKIQA